ncbi:type II toxin-antitoxin system HicB family antitoxin [Endozoicomonas sp. 4G]|uniref:type II toxin-antitoxin system HicB family antitoxin n=1 Tax=Endozoicomonas sp. 4G TaxID=2872754 RepID=UPI002078C266|nr:type II toxin-antitoxin system HicB family antitoxin [Endozoicomonas sp. 4G]
MLYPIVIHKDPDSAYGVTVPDIKGCFSAGDTFAEALECTKEAINGYLEMFTEEGKPIPNGSDIDDLVDNPDYEGGTWALVEVDITPYLGKTEKINVTLPSSLIRKIDDEVRKHSSQYRSRSSFLAQAAFREL